jgi:acetoin utilization deacetylase AcuC-like enzyme
VGSGAGEGYTLNLPVAPGADEQLWLSLLEHVVLPVAQAFTPGLLLVSAGCDAHAQDPRAGCLLQSGSFARMALLLRDLARELHIPLGAVLEGGYAPQALGSSVLETLAALGADATPVRGAPLLPAAERALEEARRYWPL